MSNPGEPIRFSVPLRNAADKPKRLGKGLGALMGETRREEPLVTDGRTNADPGASTSGLASLPVSSIEPLPR